MAGLQSGCTDFSKAAAPLTLGQAIQRHAGARLVTNILLGPSLAAEEDTNTRRETALKDPIAMGSR